MEFKSVEMKSTQNIICSRSQCVKEYKQIKTSEGETDDGILKESIRKIFEKIVPDTIDFQIDFEIILQSCND